MVYKYRPLSFRALVSLLEYEVGGEEALLRRDIDKNLWVLATGQKLGKESECAITRLAEVYKSPFGKAKKAKEKSADEIVQEIIRGGRGKK